MAMMRAPKAGTWLTNNAGFLVGFPPMLALLAMTTEYVDRAYDDRFDRAQLTEI